MSTESQKSSQSRSDSSVMQQLSIDGSQRPKVDRDNAHFFCGAGASAINIIITFPVNKVMFRQQLFGCRAHTAIRQIIHEGIITLYRGLPAPLLQKSLSTSLMFGLYHESYEKMTHEWKWSPTTSSVCSSIFAGTCEATLTPFERVQVLLLSPKYHDTFKNTYHTMATLHSYNAGVKEYFRGFTAILIRNGLSNAIFFGLRKPIKELLPVAKEQSFQNSVNDFISGALIGAMCSTLFYPINVIKTRMQSNVSVEFLTLREAFILIYNERDRNLKRFFRGSHINIARSFLSWGIINASFEMLMKVFYNRKT